MGELISRGECELQLKVEASFNMPDTQQLEVMLKDKCMVAPPNPKE